MSVNFTIEQLREFIPKVAPKLDDQSVETYNSGLTNIEKKLAINDFNTINSDPLSIVKHFKEKGLTASQCLNACKVIKRCAKAICEQYPEIQIHADITNMSAQNMVKTAYPKAESVKKKKDSKKEVDNKLIQVVKKDQEGNDVDEDQQSVSDSSDTSELEEVAPDLEKMVADSTNNTGFSKDPNTVRIDLLIESINTFKDTHKAEMKELKELVKTTNAPCAQEPKAVDCPNVSKLQEENRALQQRVESLETQVTKLIEIMALSGSTAVRDGLVLDLLRSRRQS